MLSSSDLLQLPYTPDLTEGGIAYALHSLPYMYQRAGGSVYDRLRRIVAGAAVELAFRRFLTEQNIPFEVTAVTPFTDPERYDVALGGRRCDLKSFLISRREQIAEIKQKPQVILNAPALVPSDQNAAQGHSDRDIYLFAFLPGLVAASHEDMQKAIHKKQPCHLAHVLPEAWMRPPEWKPLGKLVLKSESAETQTIEINGQDEGRETRTSVVELPPRTRVEIEEGYFSVTHIRSKSLPGARIGLHSPARRETHLIGTLDWGNLWVYGVSVLLAGWLTRAEFNQRANPIREGARVFQYDHTRTKNLAVPIQDLKPISDLLERVKEWSS